ncbi:AraC-like DNA-binding protein/mannose-6-phosphate isomerase-like protein (cupin superfamily) [Dyadobacter sp. BE34]|uniref:AraC-like DNA-binding protein/mannose-6-phosphate isomerase-like protein (Cupin superfamily) n=1 Tax=Dyadobacter fermentans TaxID=94254 RepID=A0ABU1R850_9BACT|nr:MULTISPECIES: helix-turn-helix transcriptional regulator [Dyadobacter]MDR6809587.1 AraC-like DNA-binding protein/mannose-6-phosphate isomerase-like protein (cupin superfamily) [Dyadobacter fermentans]MDR7047265.1 AraC-like DNA-binding protein/mannose-6-phosphate isomerase-like protein (cupin superfamily) [Dyadobacter sp. BE242]MDR7201501.1 AraC-like DNA-binding protein/mannose-6-phosphate isomerase-like protein (cupin superfamily) [Dyadobacter sp. BE34]MDR7219371.1 AraC-like DNA-binding prot
MKSIPVRHIAQTHQDQHDHGRFSIRELSAVLKGEDLVHDLHRHDFYFILAIEQGQGVHEIDFIKYDVHDNAIFILRPGQVHHLWLAANSRGYLLEFDNSFYKAHSPSTEAQWKRATSQNYRQVDQIRFKKLISYLSSSFCEYTFREDGYLPAIKASIELFMIEFARQSPTPAKGASAIPTYTQERYEELLRLLESNITQIKSVAEYAKMANLSIYQLNAITKASVGKTTADLINEQIILEAKRFLLATSNQIKDIAWHLGYEDTSYFIRFFRKQTGYSPEAFRKQLS